MINRWNIAPTNLLWHVSRTIYLPMYILILLVAKGQCLTYLRWFLSSWLFIGEKCERIISLSQLKNILFVQIISNQKIWHKLSTLKITMLNFLISQFKENEMNGRWITKWWDLEAHIVVDMAFLWTKSYNTCKNNMVNMRHLGLCILNFMSNWVDELMWYTLA